MQTDSESLSTLVASYRDVPGGLLPLLHAIQSEYGHIPGDAVPLIASGLNLSRADVHGVITFYHDFRTAPAGRHVVQICRAEACQALGARALEEHALSTLGVSLGETTADDAITLEGVYCLGNCACGPTVRIGDRIHARVDASRFDGLVAQCVAEDFEP